ncbi:hypothetical protein EV356DRAFT_506902 [Viridothelium virens]|uniref:Peroxin 20 n=1 Tax=Viridothelium virens TaxID=1048519 RepID=A0A6A6H0G1_VIRVR|nr:hypothetical protein EV356DRAFT_506902 [Viridothelium virens]
MGDPLCGPSNPLQNLQKQTSADRTLQQDRIASRHNAQESFRSPPGPSAGILDPEFEAFQAGHPLPLQAQVPFQPPPQASPGPSILPDWAADFQRLHVSPQYQPQSHTPASRLHLQSDPKAAPVSPWHEEFIRQQTSSQQINRNYAPQNVYSTIPQFRSQMSSMAGPSSLGNHLSTEAHAKHKQDIYNDAAFTRAFDALSEDIDGYEARQEPSNHLAAQAETERLQDAEETRNAAAELHGRFEAQRVMEKAGVPFAEDGLPTFDANVGPAGQQFEEPQHESDQERTQQAQDDADDLAATAAQLLESVADNQSAKFGNSKFLELMRKLRDREVRVEGDKMVDVNEVSKLPLSTDYGEKQLDHQRDKVLSLDLAGLNHGRTILFDDFVTCFGVPPASGEPYLNGAVAPVP